MNIGIVVSTSWLLKVLSFVKVPAGHRVVIHESLNEIQIEHTAFVAWVISENIDAVIFDERSYLQDGITHHSVQLAYELMKLRQIPVYFPVLEPPHCRMGYSIWKFFWDAERVHLRGLRKVSEEGWKCDYRYDTGQKYFCSGGDSGLERRASDCGSVFFEERDWEKVITYVTQQQ